MSAGHHHLNLNKPFFNLNLRVLYTMEGEPAPGLLPFHVSRSYEDVPECPEYILTGKCPKSVCYHRHPQNSTYCTLWCYWMPVGCIRKHRCSHRHPSLEELSITDCPLETGCIKHTCLYRHLPIKCLDKVCKQWSDTRECVKNCPFKHPMNTRLRTAVSSLSPTAKEFKPSGLP